MQAQSRLAAAASGGGGGGSGISGSGGISRLGGGAGEEHEAVVRELTRGHELTARLRAEALRALRGQGQAEATATFILGEVSRAFTVCLSIMANTSPSASPPRPDETPPPADSAAVSVGAVAPPPPPRAGREDNVPRKRLLTASPYDDGYQWRKYGQKKINNTNFPRNYYRCSYHRERRCPAQKHVQQRDGDDVPALHVVVYTHEHTCLQGAPAELPDAATNGGAAPASPDYFPAGGETPSSLRRFRAGGGGGGQPQFVDHRAAMEERERQVLVSSLARVLQGRQCYDDDDDTDVASLGAVHARAPAAAAPVAASSSSSGPVDAAGEELDVMDYDMTDALFWGPFGTDSNSYDGKPDVDTLF
uniref:WRKY domain-containing protein n=1 Tax=Oryza meridionalis TaxID=40149 RepID=A0A0E0C9J7_9ORYZ